MVFSVSSIQSVIYSIKIVMDFGRSNKINPLNVYNVLQSLGIIRVQIACK
jgi:hypothetical protein